MVKKTITPVSNSVTEARPIGMLVQLASGFVSNIYLENNSGQINAKSIMGMMTLSLNGETEITVVAEGKDEDAAVEAIEEYLCKV